MNAKFIDYTGTECMSDPVDHPEHYTSHPSGIECIEITKHMNFCLGNAMKYIFRAGKKRRLRRGSQESDTVS